MRNFYLDANVVFRLDEEGARALCDQQRRRRLRVAIGLRLVLELAGAFERKPEAILQAREQAALLLDILECGGVLARDAWTVCCDALRMPPSKRRNVLVVPKRDSDWYSEGVARLRAISRGESPDEIREWYRYAHEVESARYREAERHFGRKIQELREPKKAVEIRSLTNVLNGLEASGWLPNVTAACATALGFRKRIPARVRSDWFGPLGRLQRASIAMGALQNARYRGNKKRPRQSDLGDVYHIVVAGLVGDFVTADETAKRVFNATWPSRSRKCMHLQREFLPWLQSATT